MTVNEAEAQLFMSRLRPAKVLLKLLRSALANAKNAQMNPERLVIESFRVDGGPMLKRFLPRARGSASPIEKKMSHVTLVLAEKEGGKAPRYTIAVQKKAKKVSPEEKRAARKKKMDESQDTGLRSEKPGFFKRSFSRKSGEA
jgi:large subunit ribosomal protein L22